MGPSNGMPDWPLLYRTFPNVIVVLANPDRANLRRRMANMIALCRADPEIRAGDGVSVAFVFHHELVAQLPCPMSFHVGAQPLAKNVSKLCAAVAGSLPYQ